MSRRGPYVRAGAFQDREAAWVRVQVTSWQSTTRESGFQECRRAHRTENIIRNRERDSDIFNLGVIAEWLRR
jgi:hypothetical protein